MFSKEGIKYALIIGALVILGSVVAPRLSGWIFHRTNKSFVYVWWGLVACANIWLIQYLKEIDEKMNPYHYLIFILLYGFGALLLKVKEGDEDDPFKD